MKRGKSKGKVCYGKGLPDYNQLKLFVGQIINYFQ